MIAFDNASQPITDKGSRQPQPRGYRSPDTPPTRGALGDINRYIWPEEVDE